MPLWRVDVAGVSVRFVDAPSKTAACRLVERDLIASLGVTASRAGSHLEDTYAAAGPIQRKRLLAAMDGLTSPATRRSNRLQLDKLQRWLEREEAWIEATVAKAPPPADPEAVARIIVNAEIRHVERNLRHRADGLPASWAHQ